MSKDVTNFKGFGKGDIITLSDIQTQKEFEELTADFKVTEVRTYREPGDFFHYTGYICVYQGKSDDDEPQQVMVLLREMKEMYDLFVYYMDQDGDIKEYDWLIEEKAVEEDKEDGEESDEDTVVVIEETEEEEEDSGTTEDLVERFEVTQHFDEGDIEVTWDKTEAGSTFGVETTSTEAERDTKTFAEYFTNDVQDNPYCFIEWTGDSKNGWIEIWYGCEIKPEDLEMFRTKK